MTLYRCMWRSDRTGVMGSGTGLFPLEQAQAICNSLNVADAKYGLWHWPATAALTVPDEPGQGSEPVSMAAANGPFVQGA